MLCQQSFLDPVVGGAKSVACLTRKCKIMLDLFGRDKYFVSEARLSQPSLIFEDIEKSLQHMGRLLPYSQI
jgi:hypothetical protein